MSYSWSQFSDNLSGRARVRLISSEYIKMKCLFLKWNVYFLKHFTEIRSLCSTLPWGSLNQVLISIIQTYTPKSSCQTLKALIIRHFRKTKCFWMNEGKSKHEKGFCNPLFHPWWNKPINAKCLQGNFKRFLNAQTRCSYTGYTKQLLQKPDSTS